MHIDVGIDDLVSFVECAADSPPNGSVQGSWEFDRKFRTDSYFLQIAL